MVPSCLVHGPRMVKAEEYIASQGVQARERRSGSALVSLLDPRIAYPRRGRLSPTKKAFSVLYSRFKASMAQRPRRQLA